MFTRSLLLVLAWAIATPAAVAAPIVARSGERLRADGGTMAADFILPVASRRARVETEATGDMPGRYAVMRDKRDTGCMLTLDRSRAKGGDRAQLAPGCRDQGIVIFDPASWAVVKGALVLTARAGHKTRLLKEGEGVWKRDAKDGKPLGLRKL